LSDEAYLRVGDAPYVLLRLDAALELVTLLRLFEPFRIQGQLSGCVTTPITGVVTTLPEDGTASPLRHGLAGGTKPNVYGCPY